VGRLTQRLDSNVFERRTSTVSEPFSLIICLDDTKFVFLTVFTLIEIMYTKVWSKTRLESAKSPFPVDLRGSKRNKNACRAGGNQASHSLEAATKNFRRS